MTLHLPDGDRIEDYDPEYMVDLDLRPSRRRYDALPYNRGGRGARRAADRYSRRQERRRVHDVARAVEGVRQ